MTQSIAIMILGSATGNNSSHTALHFSEAVLAKGYRIERLFFYHEAAVIGSDLSISAQDEQNLPSDWQALISEYQLDAVVCIASGLKRGIINASEAKRYNKSQHSLHHALELSGLGQWIDAVNHADKYIVFGN
jgi:tRNA 2-thiouridine synthesizing protein D